jgi:hypothetical protein
MLEAMSAHALDTGRRLQVTGAEAAVEFHPEINRTFLFCWDINAYGSFEVSKRLTFQGGLALGALDEGLSVKTFAASEVAIPIPLPLFVKIAYIYNGMPEYETDINSIVPLVSLKWPLVGVIFGANLRFTDIFDDPTIFESMFSFYLYVNIINNARLKLSLVCANVSDFSAANLGGYSLRMQGNIRLAPSLLLLNELELLQSGSVGLSSSLYGIAYRGGLKWLW